jgi:hypothetical protein
MSIGLSTSALYRCFPVRAGKGLLYETCYSVKTEKQCDEKTAALTNSKQQACKWSNTPKVKLISLVSVGNGICQIVENAFVGGTHGVTNEDWGKAAAGSKENVITRKLINTCTDFNNELECNSYAGMKSQSEVQLIGTGNLSNDISNYHPCEH